MHVVRIPIKTGQCLMMEVMEGLVLNDCCEMAVTSYTDSIKKCSRENMARNWIELHSYRRKDVVEKVIIGMDSDVVLEEGVISDLLSPLKKGYDVSLYPTQEGEFNLFQPIQHGLWAVKMEIVIQIPLVELGGKCSMCAWIRNIQSYGFKATYASIKPLKECKRLELRKVT